jgi:hypothetical protein
VNSVKNGGYGSHFLQLLFVGLNPSNASSVNNK